MTRTPDNLKIAPRNVDEEQDWGAKLGSTTEFVSRQILDDIKSLLPEYLTLSGTELFALLAQSGLSVVDCGDHWMVTAYGENIGNKPVNQTVQPRAFHCVEIPKAGLTVEWTVYIRGTAFYAVPTVKTTSYKSGDAPNPTKMILSAAGIYPGEIPLQLPQSVVRLPRTGWLAEADAGLPECDALVYSSEVAPILLRLVREFSRTSGIPFILLIPQELPAD